MNHAQLAQQARELKARGKFDDAIALYAEVARLDPGSAVAEHNLAAALGDAGRHRHANRTSGKPLLLVAMLGKLG